MLRDTAEVKKESVKRRAGSQALGKTDRREHWELDGRI